MRLVIHLVLTVGIAATVFFTGTMAHEQTHQYIADKYDCNSSKVMHDVDRAYVSTNCEGHPEDYIDQHHQTQVFVDAVWHQLSVILLIQSLMAGLIISAITEHIVKVKTE